MGKISAEAQTVGRSCTATNPETGLTNENAFNIDNDPDLCPHCKQGQMITLLYFDGTNGPPDQQLLRKLKRKIVQNEKAV